MSLARLLPPAFIVALVVGCTAEAPPVVPTAPPSSSQRIAHPDIPAASSSAQDEAASLLKSFTNAPLAEADGFVWSRGSRDHWNKASFRLALRRPGDFVFEYTAGQAKPKRLLVHGSRSSSSIGSGLREAKSLDFAAAALTGVTRGSALYTAVLFFPDAFDERVTRVRNPQFLGERTGRPPASHGQAQGGIPPLPAGKLLAFCTHVLNVATLDPGTNHLLAYEVYGGFPKALKDQGCQPDSLYANRAQAEIATAIIINLTLGENLQDPSIFSSVPDPPPSNEGAD